MGFAARGVEGVEETKSGGGERDGRAEGVLGDAESGASMRSK